MQQWRDSLTSEDIRRQNSYLRAQKAKGKTLGMARLRDPNKPKAPETPFFQFLKDYRKSVGTGTSAPDIARGAASQWKAMSADEKLVSQTWSQARASPTLTRSPPFFPSFHSRTKTRPKKPKLSTRLRWDEVPKQEKSITLVSIATSSSFAPRAKRLTC